MSLHQKSGLSHPDPGMAIQKLVDWFSGFEGLIVSNETCFSCKGICFMETLFVEKES